MNVRIFSFKWFAVLSMMVLSACSTLSTDSLFTESLTAPYRVGSGDKLRIIVFGQDNLSNIYTVDASGKISFPLIGNVALGDMATRDIEQTLITRLKQGYIREPKVSVEVDVYRPFYVMGEVTTSGQFAYVSGTTAQTAVAIAGGFTPRADQRNVKITRKINGAVVTGVVPITHPIRPGDTIMVIERWF